MPTSTHIPCIQRRNPKPRRPNASSMTLYWACTHRAVRVHTHTQTHTHGVPGRTCAMQSAGDAIQWLICPMKSERAGLGSALCTALVVHTHSLSPFVLFSQRSLKYFFYYISFFPFFFLYRFLIFFSFAEPDTIHCAASVLIYK